jgi:hypothetical protein
VGIVPSPGSGLLACVRVGGCEGWEAARAASWARSTWGGAGCDPSCWARIVSSACTCLAVVISRPIQPLSGRGGVKGVPPPRFLPAGGPPLRVDPLEFPSSIISAVTPSGKWNPPMVLLRGTSCLACWLPPPVFWVRSLAAIVPIAPSFLSLISGPASPSFSSQVEGSSITGKYRYLLSGFLLASLRHSSLKTGQFRSLTMWPALLQLWQKRSSLAQSAVRCCSPHRAHVS